MTNKEFDKIQFNGNLSMVVRKYFGKEKIDVEYVDFCNRRVNGYHASEIIDIKPKYNEDEKDN